MDLLTAVFYLLAIVMLGSAALAFPAYLTLSTAPTLGSRLAQAAHGGVFWVGFLVVQALDHVTRGPDPWFARSASLELVVPSLLCAAWLVGAVFAVRRFDGPRWVHAFLVGEALWALLWALVATGQLEPI